MTEESGEPKKGIDTEFKEEYERGFGEKSIDWSNLKEDILSFIKRHPGTSFAEIAKKYGKGDRDYFFNSWNILLWTGLRKDVIDAIHSLLKEKKINIKAVSPLIYAMDGIVILYPIATKIKKYKTEHWIPTVYSC